MKKYNSVYVGDERKRITGNFHGLVKAYRMKNGFIFEFKDSQQAIKSAHALVESGYETVRVM